MTIELTRDERFGRVNLPPAQEIEEPNIRQAVAEFHAAANDANTARQTAVQLEQERPQAVERDAEALADAREAGKLDPGAKHTAEHDERIADAERQARAAEILRDRAFAKLAEALAAQGDEWQALAAKRLADARAKFLRAVDRLEAQQRELATAASLDGFVTNGGRYRQPGGYAAGIRASGQSLPIDAVLAGLRALAEPPREPAGDLRIVESA
jgi:hypothetical protein